MKRRQHLLLAVNSDFKEFQNFFDDVKGNINQSVVTKKSQQKLNSEKVVTYLSDVLQEFNKSQCVTLWKKVKIYCEDALRKFASNILRSEDAEEVDSQVKVKEAVDILENISLLCLSYVKIDMAVCTEDLLAIVSVLYGSLLNFSSSAPDLSQSICTLCVVWWSKDLPSRDELCLNVFIHHFNEILGSGFSKNNISSKLTNQLYQIQNALISLELNERTETQEEADSQIVENLQELRQLLASAFLHPVFLKVKNGRKFLCRVLLLKQDLMITIHETIMKHILVKSDYSDAYGNIYYLAWNLADEKYKEKLEESCIQDVMFRAIHAPHGKELFKAYCQILFSITSHNGALPVRHMVTRLYNPIIWRSLKVANAMVRANAATLLFDTFPLVNPPDGGGEDKDAFLQKQFDVIEELIMDPYPQIRSIAITGMLNILNLYWDVIPAQMIALLCKKLYTNLAFDASSLAVRLAVIKGTIVLVDNPRSHPLLQKLLPVIGGCIHDSSEKVRVAMCKVLLAVKQTSSIKYWDVCPVESLLAQLEIENRTGSNYLVNLITGSFLPQNQPTKTWVERCVNFYERNASAARKFYLYAKDHLSAMELGEFIFSLSVFIFNVVSRSLEDQAKEQIHTEEGDTSVAERPDLMAGLLETICILWMEFSKKSKSLSRPKTDKGGEGSNDLRELSKKVMTNLPRMSHVCFRKYTDQRCLNALLHLSSCLHPASMPIFSNKVIPKLRNLPDDSPRSYYEMLIKCLIKWGWTTQLLEMINEWMLVVVKKEDNGPQMEKDVMETNKSTKRSKKSKAKKGRKVQFSEESSPARPALAIDYLSVLLHNEEVTNVILSDEPCQKLMEEFLIPLQCFSTKLFERLQGSTPPNDVIPDKLLIDAFRIHLKFLASLYLFHNDEDDVIPSPGNAQSYLQRLSSLIECTQVRVVDGLKSTAQNVDIQNTSVLSTTLLNQSVLNTSSLTSKFSLVKDLLQLVFDSLSHLLRQGIPLHDQVLAFISAFTETGIKTVEYAGAVCGVLREVLECFILFSWSRDDENENKEVVGLKLTDNENTMLHVIDDVMLGLTMFSRSNRDGFTALFRSQVRSTFRSIVLMCSKYSHSVTTRFYSALVKKIISAVLADITHHKLTSREHQLGPFNHFADLPNFSSSFLPITCAAPAECEYICLHTLPDIFGKSSSNQDEDRQLALQACIVLLNVLIEDGKNSVVAKSCLKNMQQSLDEYATPNQEEATINDVAM